MPRNVSAGGDVLAGMIVSGQAVRILVTKPYDHSTLARILYTDSRASGCPDSSPSRTCCGGASGLRLCVQRLALSWLGISRNILPVRTDYKYPVGLFRRNRGGIPHGYPV